MRRFPLRFFLHIRKAIFSEKKKHFHRIISPFMNNLKFPQNIGKIELFQQFYFWDYLCKFFNTTTGNSFSYFRSDFFISFLWLSNVNIVTNRWKFLPCSIAGLRCIQSSPPLVILNLNRQFPIEMKWFAQHWLIFLCVSFHLRVLNTLERKKFPL